MEILGGGMDVTQVLLDEILRLDGLVARLELTLVMGTGARGGSGILGELRNVWRVKSIF